MAHHLRGLHQAGCADRVPAASSARSKYPTAGSFPMCNRAGGPGSGCSAGAPWGPHRTTACGTRERRDGMMTIRNGPQPYFCLGHTGMQRESNARPRHRPRNHARTHTHTTTHYQKPNYKRKKMLAKAPHPPLPFTHQAAPTPARAAGPRARSAPSPHSPQTGPPTCRAYPRPVLSGSPSVPAGLSVPRAGRCRPPAQL